MSGIAEHLPDWTAHARHVLGVGPEWEPYSFEWQGENLDMAIIRGCNQPPPLKTGPDKGEPNWRKRDKSTERIITISQRQHNEWKAKHWRKP